MLRNQLGFSSGQRRTAGLGIFHHSRDPPLVCYSCRRFQRFQSSSSSSSSPVKSQSNENVPFSSRPELSRAVKKSNSTSTTSSFSLTEKSSLNEMIDAFFNKSTTSSSFLLNRKKTPLFQKPSKYSNKPAAAASSTSAMETSIRSYDQLKMKFAQIEQRRALQQHQQLVAVSSSSSINAAKIVAENHSPSMLASLWPLREQQQQQQQILPSLLHQNITDPNQQQEQNQRIENIPSSSVEAQPPEPPVSKPKELTPFEKFKMKNLAKQQEQEQLLQQQEKAKAAAAEEAAAQASLQTATPIESPTELETDRIATEITTQPVVPEHVEPISEGDNADVRNERTSHASSAETPTSMTTATTESTEPMVAVSEAVDASMEPHAEMSPAAGRVEETPVNTSADMPRKLTAFEKLRMEQQQQTVVPNVESSKDVQIASEESLAMTDTDEIPATAIVNTEYAETAAAEAILPEAVDSSSSSLEKHAEGRPEEETPVNGNTDMPRKLTAFEKFQMELQQQQQQKAMAMEQQNVISTDETLTDDPNTFQESLSTADGVEIPTTSTVAAELSETAASTSMETLAPEFVQSSLETKDEKFSPASVEETPVGDKDIPQKLTAFESLRMAQLQKSADSICDTPKDEKIIHEETLTMTSLSQASSSPNESASPSSQESLTAFEKLKLKLKVRSQQETVTSEPVVNAEHSVMKTEAVESDATMPSDVMQNPAAKNESRTTNDESAFEQSTNLNNPLDASTANESSLQQTLVSTTESATSLSLTVDNESVVTETQDSLRTQEVASVADPLPKPVELTAFEKLRMQNSRPPLVEEGLVTETLPIPNAMDSHEAIARRDIETTMPAGAIAESRAQDQLNNLTQDAEEIHVPNPSLPLDRELSETGIKSEAPSRLLNAFEQFRTKSPPTSSPNPNSANGLVTEANETALNDSTTISFSGMTSVEPMVQGEVPVSISLQNSPELNQSPFEVMENLKRAHREDSRRRFDDDLNGSSMHLLSKSRKSNLEMPPATRLENQPIVNPAKIQIQHVPEIRTTHNFNAKQHFPLNNAGRCSITAELLESKRPLSPQELLDVWKASLNPKEGKQKVHIHFGKEESYSKKQSEPRSALLDELKSNIVAALNRNNPESKVMVEKKKTASPPRKIKVRILMQNEQTDSTTPTKQQTKNSLTIIEQIKANMMAAVERSRSQENFRQKSLETEHQRRQHATQLSRSYNDTQKRVNTRSNALDHAGSVAADKEAFVEHEAKISPASVKDSLSMAAAANIAIEGQPMSAAPDTSMQKNPMPGGLSLASTSYTTNVANTMKINASNTAASATITGNLPRDDFSAKLTANQQETVVSRGIESISKTGATVTTQTQVLTPTAFDAASSAPSLSSNFPDNISSKKFEQSRSILPSTSTPLKPLDPIEEIRKKILIHRDDDTKQSFPHFKARDQAPQAHFATERANYAETQISEEMQSSKHEEISLDSLRAKFAVVNDRQKSSNELQVRQSGHDEEKSKQTAGMTAFELWQQKQRQKRQHQQPQTIPQQTGTKPPNQHSSTMVDTPLSELVRHMQLKNEAENRRKMEQQSDQMSLLKQKENEETVLPQWRLRDDQSLRQERLERQFNLEQQRFQEKTHPARHENAKKKKHITPDPKLQKVILPNFDVSITETSQLFRAKASRIRSILRAVGVEEPVRTVENENGEKWTVPVDDEFWMVSPENLEFIALELNIPYEKSTQAKTQNDDEILLQRRAAAEIDDAPLEDEAAGKSESAATKYESLPPRPPVVCVMGHVDHGKTTLMDALRRRAAGINEDKGKRKKKKDKKDTKKSGKYSGDVAGTEAGGITQVISAFQVPLAGGSAVTFLDTPGHAAFKAMRQSGSDAADIIVLVVAADDGVSAQTIEILNFYKSIVKGAGKGGISMIVALNKIDKHGINVNEAMIRVQNQLLEHGIMTEGMVSDSSQDFGHPVQMVPISALTGKGLDDLIESIVLQSDIMDLRADVEARAEGIVMDARVEKGMGVVADCIIRWGSINKGDIVVSGTHMGKVKIIKDANNSQLKVGLPSQPVKISGFDTVPKAGDPIVCVESEAVAEELVRKRQAIASGEESSISTVSDAELQSAGKHMMSTEWKAALEEKYNVHGDDKEGKIRIPILVKADADGTLSAIRDSLVQLGESSKHNVLIDPVKTGVGPVLGTEIQLAKEFGAPIICFNVKNEQLIINVAADDGVKILQSDVIYTVLEEAKLEFTKFLPVEDVEIFHGRGKVKAIFDIDGMDEKVAGVQVNEGKLIKGKVKSGSSQLQCRFRVLRNGEVLVDNLEATSLKHFKTDVEEVTKGKDCGISLASHNDFEEGDVIECFSVEQRSPTF